METTPDTQQNPCNPAAVPPSTPSCDTPATSIADGPTPDADIPPPCGDLNANQLRLLAALVISTDLQTACTTANVSRTSAYLWMKQPAFQEELKRQRNAAYRDAMTTVKVNATRAAAEMVRLLDESDPNLRWLVCRDILARAVRIHEMEEIEPRLAAIEKAMKQQIKDRL
jgi:hypothetical protein